MDGSISIANNQIKEQTTLSFVANLSMIHKRTYKQETIMGLQSTQHREQKMLLELKLCRHGFDLSSVNADSLKF